MVKIKLKYVKNNWKPICIFIYDNNGKDILSPAWQNGYSIEINKNGEESVFLDCPRIGFLLMLLQSYYGIRIKHNIYWILKGVKKQ